MAEFVNQLHYGDNLVRLRGDGVDKAIPDEVADLIYLDPPFNSARNYNLLFKQHKGQDSPAQIMTFKDTWTYGPLLMQDFKSDGRNSELFELMDSLHRILGPSEMMAYLLMMAPRLLELHRKLKSTGSLYLHCDPVASHYLKIILDVVFGPEHFRNEITWKRTSAHNDASKYGCNTDTLLYFTKGNGKWHQQYRPHTPEYISRFRHKDADGRPWTDDNLSAKGLSGGGYTYEYKGISGFWRCPPETMERLDAEGRLHFTNAGGIRLKRYLDENKGTTLQALWDDIPPINSQAKERRGYPTQKPLALLERIIAASTDEGDVVLDPFAGCGTAMVAAERMNRRWIGIDVTYLAINEVIARLGEEKAEGRELKYELLGTPRDEGAAKALFESTKHQNHKPFEQWAVTLVGGKWNDKKGADRGIDGRIQLWDMQGNYREGVVQVKGGNGLNLSNVRDFAHVIENNKAVFGIMIAQKEPTKEMKLVAENMGYAEWPGNKKIPRYQILTTEGILERGETAILPESWLIQPDKGVGRAVQAQSGSLFDGHDE
ncbi:MAG: site-specific DNA-methyltransferase [Fimbriimonas sp.]